MRVSDFRSERMPSAEGRGLAQSRFRHALEAYERTSKGAVEPAARWLAARMTEELVGFWLIWQLEGGFEGLRRLGLSRSAIYRRVAAFRKAFGAHPDEFSMPGVSVDVTAYLAGTSREPAPRG